MGGGAISHRLRRLALAGLLGLFVAGTAQPADASKPRDPEVMRVGPIVTVALADEGRLEDGGTATVIDVAVACPVGSTGQQSPVFLYPSQGFYLPTCDGSSHTFSVQAR